LEGRGFPQTGFELSNAADGTAMRAPVRENPNKIRQISGIFRQVAGAFST
jgi:hypothetical protein